MIQEQDIRDLTEIVKERTLLALQGADMFELASLDWLQGLLLTILQVVWQGVVEAWKETLFFRARSLLGECPACGKRRKWRWRRSRRLKLSLLGFDFHLPSPQFECPACDAPGLAVVSLLTGLRSGATSGELDLRVGREGVLHSYARATDNLKAHHGQEMERTKVRRSTIKLEGHAMEYVEELRRSADKVILPLDGPHCLIIEADGGSARTGIMVPCEEGDDGYGQKTPMRGILRRKKTVQNREIITMDCRAPGESSPRVLDVMVPALSPDGERGRLMRTMAVRAGRGQDTKMRGLGDMGSFLGLAFDDTFGRPHFWSGDWKHLTDYVDKAAAILVDFDTQTWKERVEDALWNRHREMVDYLLSGAFGHLPSPLPDNIDKCPLHALHTYVNNNWNSLWSKRMRDEGLPYISARAESQVRDRTRARFGGAGTWHEENLAPKATLLSIILEGAWEKFAQWYRTNRAAEFHDNYISRWHQAFNERRVTRNALETATAQRYSAIPKATTQPEEEHDLIAVDQAA